MLLKKETVFTIMVDIKSRRASFMEYTNKTRTVTAYLRDIKKEAISFQHKIQRKNNQWNKQQKSKLIVTMIKGYMPIPPIHVLDEDGILWVIDGKQRLTTIRDFVNDDFKLDKSTPSIEVNGETVELAKKKFSDIPEELQTKIKETEIIQVKYTDYTDEQIANIYAALNNGTPLSADQKLRAALPADVLEAIDDVLESPFFEKTNLTAGQIRKGEDLSVVLQAAMLISEYDFKDFSGTEMLAFAEECDLSLIKALRNACDELDAVIPERQKLLKKISLPMIIAVAAKHNNVKAFGKKLEEFFEGYDNNDDYKQYCMTSTARKENVVGRWEYFKNL